ncbi:hypothetical protein HK103_003282 [Boothiomyces macroporosus]|uniref:Uncharacterized protein n=1 Tax=Boothiomyces macroporosus TaxID=261099 RepID=A0AAD5Y446_9FUNG|nr:hypothetical protein HK103_003282 [Boothiomyces macroporosus]
MSEGLSRLQQVLGNQKQEQPKFAIQTQVKQEPVTFSPRTLNAPIRHSPLVKEILIEDNEPPRFRIAEDPETNEEWLPKVVVDHNESATTIQENKTETKDEKAHVDVSIDTELDSLPRFQVNEPVSPPETEINPQPKQASGNTAGVAEPQNKAEEAIRVSTVKSEKTTSTLNTIHSSDKDSNADKESEVEQLPRFVIPAAESAFPAKAPQTTSEPPVLSSQPNSTISSSGNTNIVTASNVHSPVLSAYSTLSAPTTFISAIANTTPSGTQNPSFSYSPGQYYQEATRLSATSFNIPPPPSDTQSEIDLSDIELETDDYIQKKKELEQKLKEFMAVGKQETQLGKRIAKSLKRRNVTVHSELDDFEIGAALREYEIHRQDSQVTASAQALEALKQSLLLAVPSKMSGPPAPPLPSVKTIMEQRELQYQQYARYAPQTQPVQPQVPFQIQPQVPVQPQMGTVPMNQAQPTMSQTQPQYGQRTCPNCKRMTSINSRATGFCCFKVTIN